MRIVHGPAVFEELLNISAYIAFDNEPVAQHFLDACDETFRFLAVHPNIGVARSFRKRELREVRMWRVKGFEKYLVFYCPIPEGLKILHVVYSARDYRRLFDDET